MKLASQLHLGLSEGEPPKSRKAHIALAVSDLHLARQLLRSLVMKSRNQEVAKTVSDLKPLITLVIV